LRLSHDSHRAHRRQLAGLLLSDADPRDREFIHGERTPEGFYQFRGGIDAAIARGPRYAPYADMLWCEPPLRISPKRGNSPTPFMRNSQGNSWL